MLVAKINLKVKQKITIPTPVKHSEYTIIDSKFNHITVSSKPTNRANNRKLVNIADNPCDNKLIQDDITDFVKNTAESADKIAKDNQIVHTNDKSK